MHMNVVILIFADYFLYLDGTDIVFVVGHCHISRHKPLLLARTTVCFIAGTFVFVWSP